MSTAKSTYTVKKAILTTPDILAGIEEYGDDVMVIDFDTMRDTQYAKYVPVYIKNGNGELIHARFWKLSGQGLFTCSGIPEPAKRAYEQVRLGVSQMNDQEEEIDNMKAMQALCEIFERKMNQYVEDKFITDDKKKSKKQADGAMRPVLLMSTKIETPMLTEKLDKETGDYVPRPHPVYYLSIPKKRFYNAGETPKESIHYNNECYFESDKPIMSFEYQPAFYNIEDFYHHPRTGKKIYKKLGDLDEETGDVNLDNTNIQKHIPRGSAMVGALKFEMISVGKFTKLDFQLYGTMYVRKGVMNQDEGVDDECLDEFAERYTTKPSGTQINLDLDEPNAEDF